MKNNQSVHNRYLILFSIFISTIIVQYAFPSSLSAQTSTSSQTISTTFSIENYVDWSITILGFFLGFLFIFYQISKQHKNTINLQKRQFKEKILYDIFNDISKEIKSTTNSYATLSTSLIDISLRLDSDIFLKNNGVTTDPLSESPNSYQYLHYSFTQSILELIFTLEKYSITDRIFEIFNLALQTSSYDLGKIFQEIHNSLIKLLPIDVPKEKQEIIGRENIEHKCDKNAELKKLKEYIKLYNIKLIDTISYIKDLEIEIQNIFLSEIFENSLSPRKSKDSEYVVISKKTTRSLDEIKSYFLNETAYGQNWQQAQKRKKS